MLYPFLEEKVIETLPDGSVVKNDALGHIVRVKPGVVSIPAEIGTLLTGREAWEELFLPRLRFCEERLNIPDLEEARAGNGTREIPLGLYCGGLYGSIRDMLGVEHLSYLDGGRRGTSRGDHLYLREPELRARQALAGVRGGV